MAARESSCSKSCLRMPARESCRSRASTLMAARESSCSKSCLRMPARESFHSKMRTPMRPQQAICSLAASPVATSAHEKIASVSVPGCHQATAYCVLPTPHCLLPTAYCPLPTAYCPLPTPHCLLPTAYCPLPTAHCLQPVSPRSRSARKTPSRIRAPPATTLRVILSPSSHTPRSAATTGWR